VHKSHLCESTKNNSGRVNLLYNLVKIMPLPLIFTHAAPNYIAKKKCCPTCSFIMRERKRWRRHKYFVSKFSSFSSDIFSSNHIRYRCEKLSFSSLRSSHYYSRRAHENFKHFTLHNSRNNLFLCNILFFVTPLSSFLSPSILSFFFLLSIDSK
jgi:hypothetical protein